MVMIPERMTSFHAADPDTGASIILEVISEAYVKWLEESIKAFVHQAGAQPHISNAFASKAFENLQAWYNSRNPIK